MGKFLPLVILALLGCRGPHEPGSTDSNLFEADTLKDQMKSSVSGKKAPLGEMKGVVIFATLDYAGGKDEIASDKIADIVTDTVLTGLEAKRKIFTVVAVNARSIFAYGYDAIREEIIAKKKLKIEKIRAEILRRKIPDVDTKDESLEQLFLMVYDDDIDEKGSNLKTYEKQFFAGLKPGKRQIMVAIIGADGKAISQELIPYADNQPAFDDAINNFSKKMSLLLNPE